MKSVTDGRRADGPLRLSSTCSAAAFCLALALRLDERVSLTLWAGLALLSFILGTATAVRRRRAPESSELVLDALLAAAVAALAIGYWLQRSYAPPVNDPTQATVLKVSSLLIGTAPFPAALAVLLNSAAVRAWVATIMVGRGHPPVH